MLERVEHPKGVVTYQSPLLRAVGVPHGFSTRIGGISPPPYDTLNLDSLEKDEATDGNTNIAENFRRLRAALGIERYVRVEVKQIHGGEVWAPPAEPVKLRDAPCADAIVTTHPQQMLAIRTADCVPILIASPDGRVVAAIHAGWRGVVHEVAIKTVNTIYEQHNVSPHELFAAIGPAISAKHFEVGHEVGIAFAGARLEQAVLRTSPKPHVDLHEAVHQQLVRAGLDTARIDRPAPETCCTYEHADEFFSHRRDVTHRGLPATGRMAAVIAVRG